MNSNSEQTLHEILKELRKINQTLESMKQQEYDYWETWKKAKSSLQEKCK